MDKIRKIHQWASLLVGLQLLLWLISGLYFNVMDHHKVSGNQYRDHVHHETHIVLEQLIEPKEILTKAKAITSIKLITLLGQPYYLLNHEKGLYPNFKNHYSLYHAYTGAPTEIDKNKASQIALQSYNGPGDISVITLIKGKLEDIPQQKNPSWQVNFNDEVNTSVYIEVGSGRVVGHSDDDKRFASIFFMLHFMDYTNEGNFNNMQIMFFAFITLWLSTTGMIWTVKLARKGQYKVKWLR